MRPQVSNALTACNCVKYVTISRIKALGAATCVRLASLTFLLWTRFEGAVGRCWVQAQPVPRTLLPHQGPHPWLVLTTTKAPQLSACGDNAAGPGGAEISLAGGEKEKMDSHRRWRKGPWRILLLKCLFLHLLTCRKICHELWNIEI